MQKDIMVECIEAEDVSSRVRIVLWMLLSLDSKFDVIRVSAVSVENINNRKIFKVKMYSLACNACMDTWHTY